MPIAIDLFCGAGGLAEGILQSGLDIVFSSDKNEQVKNTYINRSKQLGYVEGKDTHFELMDIQDLSGEIIIDSINNLDNFKENGKSIGKGDIDVSFGGPPCQGFSRAGKRSQDDPRNLLFHEYIRIIDETMPKYVVMENVSGFLDMQMLDFPSVTQREWRGQHLVKDILKTELEDLGYIVLEPRLLNAADYGVPQNRFRAIFLAYRKDQKPIEYPKPVTLNNKITVSEAFDGLDSLPVTEFGSQSFYGRTKGPSGHALQSDTIKMNNEVSYHDSSVVQRFSLYNFGESTKNVSDRIKRDGIDLEKYDALFYETLFQVNKDSNKYVILNTLKEFNIEDGKFSKSRWIGQTNKLLSKIAVNPSEQLLKKLAVRFTVTSDQIGHVYSIMEPKLNQEITAAQLSNAFKKGNVDDAMLDALLTKKNSRKRLDPKSQAPTMVTLPDDFIHPYLNRILTVREMARIQSFDDSFEFLGKRTTGGVKRKVEVPQYSQVGNAVPPLLGKAVASVVYNALTKKDEG
ncbi:DNA cytosine methyltransferase [Pediococcus pentosaceus]|uniref:DNA cytosine methyltransferase n=1 Tax=Pediococcus pentosaceus TaxID=1255 RepID=UPI000CFFAF85|nr:DNA cytosine methyltransferase [Pediococcus pentosaceus]AVL02146.1 hypothetical protein PP40703_04730 [Pediococcus pentosaceus]MBF7134324.1 DNA cytosine methyltransferase [Pediococcus pentosaceus]QPT36271.1 DNA cytosine methyltransferase [Pediococcus pentosaceus]